MADPKDLKKSVEETVNQILSAEAAAANGGATQQIADPTAAVTKAMPASSPANGGEDKIRSGSPMTEEEKAEEAKKAKDADEEKKRKEKDEDDAKKAMASKESKESKEEEDKEKEACKSKDKMKKSIEELASHLDADELELVKTWREECAKDAIAKSQPEPTPAAAPFQMEQLQEVLKKAICEQTADLKKAIDDKDTLIKGLTDKIEKMASQPAYDRRSISTLETLEKSGANASGELTKSQVLDKMLELQAAGKGVTSHHVAEFEATKNISDPAIRGLVFRELKVN